MLVRIHLILHSPTLQRKIRRHLRALEDQVVLSADAPGAAAPHSLQTTPADLVFIREELIEGPIAAFAERCHGLPDRPGLVVITRSREAEHRTTLLAEGVDAVLGEFDPDAALSGALQEIVRSRQDVLLRMNRAQDRDRSYSLADFVAESESTRQFLELVRRVLQSSTSVLIQGETGVGKERLARILHHEGTRSEGPFVVVNCAAIPAHLLESELFGHVRGAFTDAARDKRGKFEIANGGTIFLDEIGEMPLAMQVKLLRVLQEREVERVGSESAIPIDVRVLSATHVDLEHAVQEKTFRADLYYRLSVVTLPIPPLRERSADVPSLAHPLPRTLRAVPGTRSLLVRRGGR